MIIAYPVDWNNGLESRISEDFAEADSFILFDTETGKMENAVHMRGKSIADSSRKAALLISESGAEAVVVKLIGCAAVNRLRGLGVTAYTSRSGILKDDIELCRSDKLTAIRAGECDNSCK